MRVLLQRVNNASVKENNDVIGKIGKGYLLLVGIEDSDDITDIDYLVHKVSKLRIFEDKNGKMNLNLSSIDGSILSVSQFTLYANTKKGNRPSFFNAGKPDYSHKIYDQFNEKLKEVGFHVETGHFGANMQIQLENDGPATFMLDSDNK